MLYASRVSFVRPALVAAVCAVALVLVAGPERSAEASAVSSLTSSGVTIYGAKWCSACKSLEKGLAQRNIAFDLVDVDDNPSAFERAKTASGEGGAIPLTSIVKDGKTTWIVGADVDAVERAQR